MVVLFLICWGTSILFSIVAPPICISSNRAKECPFFHILLQHLLSLVFLMIDILTGMQWYLMVVLICISSMAYGPSFYMLIYHSYILFSDMSILYWIFLEMQKSLSFFFWLHHVACGILVPQPGIKPRPSAVRAWSPNHWTSREFHPNLYFLMDWFFSGSVLRVLHTL